MLNEYANIISVHWGPVFVQIICEFMAICQLCSTPGAADVFRLYFRISEFYFIDRLQTFHSHSFSLLLLFSLCLPETIELILEIIVPEQPTNTEPGAVGLEMISKMLVPQDCAIKVNNRTNYLKILV